MLGNAVRVLVLIPLALAVACTEVAKTTVALQLRVVREMMMWTVAVLSLPVRAVSAMWRERELEAQLRDMRRELESARRTIRSERRIMELIIHDLEDDLSRRRRRTRTTESRMTEAEAIIIITPQSSTAVTRTAVSAVLCLCVGVVSLDGRPMPLVAALFPVVAISINSVVQLLSKSSDALLLLAFNSFILGFSFSLFLYAR